MRSVYNSMVMEVSVETEHFNGSSKPKRTFHLTMAGKVMDNYSGAAP